MKRLLLAALLACLIYPAFAFWQSRDSNYNVSIQGSLPGPPTFVYQSRGTATGSGNGPYTTSALGIGTASANRRIYDIYVETAGSIPAVTACSIGGVTCDVTYSVPPGTNTTITVLSALVPSGTTAVVSLTYASAPSGIHPHYLYTTDTTTLSSITPALSGITNAASGATLTASLSSIPSGSAVLYGFSAFAITNGSQAISSSTPTFTQSATFGATAAGLANDVTSGTATINYGWTTSTTGGAMGLVAIR